MSFSKQVVCPRCDGTGTVKDYTARDIPLGSNDWEGTTMEVQCPTCLGQGHINVNPPVEDEGQPND